MKFTLNWLKEIVPFSGTAEELGKLLTRAGLELESLTPLREPESGREDWLLEIGVTPNRGDCLGLLGIAREVCALTGAHLTALPGVAAKKDSRNDRRVAVRIDAGDLCARYSARIADGVTIAPSPVWMRHRLESCGIRAINNVVDVTNYVMLETGQPLHAFDLDRLEHKNIIVRSAGDIHRFTTLDGVERELRSDDLLICDGETPVALAGVMGGMNSEVTAATRSILLESANFSAAAVRRTAKRLALHSEASHRFERGVDPDGTMAALQRAIYLIAECTGGVCLDGAADCYPQKARSKTIGLRAERIEKLLGLAIPLKNAAKLLGSLGLKTARQKKSLKVTVPTHRPDLTREADLIEELARLHGYDNIPITLPLLRPAAGAADFRLACERKLRGFFAGEGFAEAINLPFTSGALNRHFSGLWDTAPAPVGVLNPLAKESGEMRQSLLPGLIENLRFNLAHRAVSFRAYQLGKVFCLNSQAEPVERQCVGGVIQGARLRRGLRLKDDTLGGFLECKGLVEGILDLLGLAPATTWQKPNGSMLHPGRAAQVFYNEASIGTLGELHPDLAETLEVQQVYVFELDFEKLLEYAPRQIAARALPRFPAIERDIAMVVDRDFASHQIIAWIESLGESLIEHVQVFDQYIGAPIPDGKKSLAYNISYRAEDRTLTDAEVNPLHQILIDRLGQEFGAARRS